MIGNCDGTAGSTDPASTPLSLPKPFVEANQQRPNVILRIKPELCVTKGSQMHANEAETKSNGNQNADPEPDGRKPSSPSGDSFSALPRRTLVRVGGAIGSAAIAAAVIYASRAKGQADERSASIRSESG